MKVFALGIIYFQFYPRSTGAGASGTGGAGGTFQFYPRSTRSLGTWWPSMSTLTFNSIQDQPVLKFKWFIHASVPFNSIQDQRSQQIAEWIWKNIFQFYPRSTQTGTVNISNQCSTLSILSKINWITVASWVIICILSILSKINTSIWCLFIVNDYLSFNSIQDQPMDFILTGIDTIVYFQFYPRSTKGKYKHRPENLSVAFNSIQDQRWRAE